MDRIDITPDLSFSRIVYGMWRIGNVEDTSPDTVRAKLDACLDQGITTFDQADIYGGYEAEAILGTALSPALRDRMEIVTKCDIVAPVGRYADRRVKYYDTSRDHIVASVNASLAALGTDRIDLLLIHRPDPLMDHAETGAALDEVIASGKVRAVGVSNFRPYDWSLLQSAIKAPLVTNQIELSLTHNAPLTNGDVAFHQQHGVPVMAWSPLGGGALMQGDAELSDLMHRIGADFGVDAAAVAVAWLLRHPARIMPIMGTNNLTRIRALSDALKVKLDRQTWFELYTAALGSEVP